MDVPPLRWPAAETHAASVPSVHASVIGRGGGCFGGRGRGFGSRPARIALPNAGGRRRRTGRRCCGGWKASRLGPLGNTFICWMAHKVWLAAHPHPGVGHASSQELSHSERHAALSHVIVQCADGDGGGQAHRRDEAGIARHRRSRNRCRTKGARKRPWPPIPPRTRAAVAEVGLRYLARLSRCTHVSPVGDGRTWTADHLQPYKIVARGCSG